MSKKNYHMTEESLECISQVATEFGGNATAALNHIVKTYNKLILENQINIFASAVIDEFDNRYKARYMDPIRLRTGYSDKNIQVLLDTMNSLLTDTNSPFYDYESTPHWTMAQSLDRINKKVAQFKQKKDNKAKS